MTPKRRQIDVRPRRRRRLYDRSDETCHSHRVALGVIRTRDYRQCASQHAQHAQRPCSILDRPGSQMPDDVHVRQALDPPRLSGGPWRRDASTRRWHRPGTGWADAARGTTTPPHGDAREAQAVAAPPSRSWRASRSCTAPSADSRPGDARDTVPHYTARQHARPAPEQCYREQGARRPETAKRNRGRLFANRRHVAGAMLLLAVAFPVLALAAPGAPSPPPASPVTTPLPRATQGQRACVDLYGEQNHADGELQPASPAPPALGM